eukprot:1172331-Pyramimonas_sp.AAC.1
MPRRGVATAPKPKRLGPPAASARWGWGRGEVTDVTKHMGTPLPPGNLLLIDGHEGCTLHRPGLRRCAECGHHGDPSALAIAVAVFDG